MAVMTNKQKPSRSVPGKKRQKASIQVWIEPAVREGLGALVTKTRRSLTAEIELALEAHLRAAGLWPAE